MAIYLNQWDVSQEDDPYKLFQKAQDTFLKKTNNLFEKLFDFLFSIKNTSLHSSPSNPISSTIFNNFIFAIKNPLENYHKNQHKLQITKKTELILGLILKFINTEKAKEVSYPIFIKKITDLLETQKNGQLSEKQTLLKASSFF